MRILLSFTLIAAAVLPCAAKRVVTPEDYFAFESIADAHISPDGKQVAWVLTTVDQAKNRRETSIWVVGIDGQSAPRRLTAAGVNSNAPQWSPDGSHLAFLSTRGEGSERQIWMLPMDGGEAQMLTHVKNGVSAFRWSPDGKHFALTSRTGPS